jgi:aminoglycoside phosphotransferase (APT) family kinase protein
MPFEVPPPTWSYEFPTQEVMLVLRDYNCEPWELLSHIQQGKKVLHTGTSIGTARKAFIKAGSTAYIVKNLPWFCKNEKAVRATLELMSILRDHKVPIPRVMHTAAGAAYVLNHEDSQPRFYVLQELAVGDPWSADIKELRGAAAVLANIHSILVRPGLSDEAASKLSVDSIFASSSRAIEAVRSRYYEAPYQRSGIAALCDEFSRRLEELERSVTHDFRMPVHGDFNPTNLLFGTDGRVVAVLDFDSAHLDHPLVDTACGILYMSSVNIDIATQKYLDVPDRFDQRKAETFLDHYVANADWVERYLGDLRPIGIALAMKTCMFGLLSGAWMSAELSALRQFVNTAGKGFESLCA